MKISAFSLVLRTREKYWFFSPHLKKVNILYLANFFVFNMAKKIRLGNFLGLSKIYMGLNFCWCPGSQGRNRNQA